MEAAKNTDVVLVAIYDNNIAYTVIDRLTMKATYPAAFACNHLYNDLREIENGS